MEDYFDELPRFVRHQINTNGSYDEISHTIYQLRPKGLDDDPVFVLAFSEELIAQLFIDRWDGPPIEIVQYAKQKDVLMILSCLDSLGVTDVIVDGKGEIDQFHRSGKRLDLKQFYLSMRVKKWV